MRRGQNYNEPLTDSHQTCNMVFVNKLLKERSIKLRRLGRSYSEISGLLKVNKSTLSGWLKDLPLSELQKKKIESRRPQWIENYKKAVKIRNEIKITRLISDVKKEYRKLTNRDWEIAGAYLYWGEGEKGKSSAVSISNTNPDILLFAINWLEKCYKIERKDMKFYLHLYQDMNINLYIKYWSNYLGVNINQFAKPYIKETKKANLDYKSYGYGTCRLYYGSVKIKNRILALIKMFLGQVELKGPVVQW